MIDLPSGTTHLKLELFVLPILLLSFYVWFSQEPFYILLFAIAYLFSSLLLSPDLDLHKNRSKTRWGALGWIWAPYSRLFKHRGLSHSLLGGSLTRLLYLGLIIWITSLGYEQIGLFLPTELIPQIELEHWAIMGTGLYLPNALHILLDHISSALSRSRRKKKIGYVRQISRQ